MIDTLYTIATFIAVISVVVFVHEFGHYIVGRWCGIHAEVFSVGMGPVIWGSTDRRGTYWQIAALPIGGYVKFLGDENAASAAGPNGLSNVARGDEERTLIGASLWKRALTVAAGPFANFFFSILVFASLLYVTGIARDPVRIGDFTVDPIELQEGDRILAFNGETIEGFADIFDLAAETAPGEQHIFTIERDDRVLDVQGPYPYPALVGWVTPLSPAANAGLQPDDLIVSFNGIDIGSFDQLRVAVLERGEVETDIVVLRGDTEISLRLAPEITEQLLADGTIERRPLIGVGAGSAIGYYVETPTPYEALNVGVIRTWGIVTGSLTGLYHIIRGDLGADNLQGPIGIARASADTAAGGWMDLIAWIGVISTAIGLMNLFPIPVLDGGHLVLYAYEAVRGKPPRERIAAALTAGGFSLLIGLMVFATYNDVLRLLNA
ncbi:MAG: RIP metalloprotease RseP [Pseudomonadota bacterium]